MDTFIEIPKILREKLNGYTINEALAMNIIDDIGNDEGNFIFEKNGSNKEYYSIVQGYAVKCSLRAKEFAGNNIQNIGELKFYYIHTQKYENFFLGAPSEVILGKTII